MSATASNPVPSRRGAASVSEEMRAGLLPQQDGARGIASTLCVRLGRRSWGFGGPGGAETETGAVDLPSVR